jgi:ribokinase
MHEKPPTVVVLGDINADLAMFVDGFPAAGGDVLARRILWGSGGGGLNAAVALSTLGAAVRLVGRVGDDPAADVALRSAVACGVDCSSVRRVRGGSTGLCTVMVTPDGQRTFLSYRGENAQLVPHELTDELLDACCLLYASAYALLVAPQSVAAHGLMQLAFERGVPVVLDACAPAASRARELMLSLAPRLRALIANEAELQDLLACEDPVRAAADLLAQGLGALVVKRGALGCSILCARDRVHAPAESVRVVDTTACGDVFSAACAWALVRGATPGEAAQLANTFAALTATRPGAAPSIPSRDALTARLPLGLLRLLQPPEPA